MSDSELSFSGSENSEDRDFVVSDSCSSEDGDWVCDDTLSEHDTQDCPWCCPCTVCLCGTDGAEGCECACCISNDCCGITTANVLKNGSTRKRTRPVRWVHPDTQEVNEAFLAECSSLSDDE